MYTWKRKLILLPCSYASWSLHGSWDSLSSWGSHGSWGSHAHMAHMAYSAHMLMCSHGLHAHMAHMLTWLTGLNGSQGSLAHLAHLAHLAPKSHEPCWIWVLLEFVCLWGSWGFSNLGILRYLGSWHFSPLAAQNPHELNINVGGFPDEESGVQLYI